MGMRVMRFGLRHCLWGFTLATILFGATAYIVDEGRKEQVRVFRKAYLEGRVSRATAREHVGDLVDSWPDMPPIHVSPEPWRERYKFP